MENEICRLHCTSNQLYIELFIDNYLDYNQDRKFEDTIIYFLFSTEFGSDDMLVNTFLTFSIAYLTQISCQYDVSFTFECLKKLLIAFHNFCLIKKLLSRINLILWFIRIYQGND